MKDETMAGYYQLLIAIFCNLNAREASLHVFYECKNAMYCKR